MRPLQQDMKCTHRTELKIGTKRTTARFFVNLLLRNNFQPGPGVRSEECVQYKRKYKPKTILTIKAPVL